MSQIAIIGMGPIGLATADRLVRRGHTVTMIGPDAKATSNKGSGFLTTYPAAAAFWTPFCSGTQPAEECKLSKLSLDFYENLRNQLGDQKCKDAGIVWRKVEQHFVEGKCGNLPDWREHRALKFKTFSKAKSTLYDLQGRDLGWSSKPSSIKIRREFRYDAPTIQSDKFIPWYIQRLEAINVSRA